MKTDQQIAPKSFEVGRLGYVDDIHGDNNDHAKPKEENENGNEKIACGVY